MFLKIRRFETDDFGKESYSDDIRECDSVEVDRIDGDITMRNDGQLNEVLGIEPDTKVWVWLMNNVGTTVDHWKFS